MTRRHRFRHGDWESSALRLDEIICAHSGEERDFHVMSEYQGKAGRIGKELVQLTRKMFRFWHGVRDGTMSRARFKLKMKPLQRRVEDLLRRGVISGVLRVAGMCWDIGGIHADALWTFVEVIT